MATSITISKINWGNPPDSIQSVTLEYKLWNASSWTLMASGVQVDIDGSILDSPLPSATGLTEDELYYIRGSNECQSPLDYFSFSVNT